MQWPRPYFPLEERGKISLRSPRRMAKNFASSVPVGTFPAASPVSINSPLGYFFHSFLMYLFIVSLCNISVVFLCYVFLPISCLPPCKKKKQVFIRPADRFIITFGTSYGKERNGREENSLKFQNKTDVVLTFL